MIFFVEKKVYMAKLHDLMYDFFTKKVLKSGHFGSIAYKKKVFE